MFRLLHMLVSTARTAAAEAPWTCAECGHSCPSEGARRHMITHRCRTLSKEPLAVELRCWDVAKDLGPALAELKRRWPGRKFQLLPGDYAEGMEGGGRKLRSIIAVEDDWLIPHDPFGPV